MRHDNYTSPQTNFLGIIETTSLSTSLSNNKLNQQNNQNPIFFSQSQASVQPRSTLFSSTHWNEKQKLEFKFLFLLHPLPSATIFLTIKSKGYDSSIKRLFITYGVLKPKTHAYHMQNSAQI